MRGSGLPISSPLSAFMLQNNRILSFFRAGVRGDWSQSELAEFYRVEDALTKSGVGISTDRGLTDEGEPWFVFFRQDNEEVIVHFARIGGEYVVASNFAEAVFRGQNFQTLVRELLDSHPYVLPKRHSPRSTVFLHPATLLAALVVTGYVKSSELNASADDGSRPEKPLGWFLNRHDLAATYSAIVMASVWDSLAIDGSVSKPSDVLLSVDPAQAAHDAHGSDIGQAVADDSLLQDIQAFHGTDDHSVLTAAALDLDGQDAVHVVIQPVIAGPVANASGFKSESSHHDNTSVSSVHDVFHAENDLEVKLADFHLQLGDGLPIAAREQVERTVTYNPVCSSATDHLAPQHVSTAPTAAIAHSDTTTAPNTAPNNVSSALAVDNTNPSLLLNVTTPSGATQAPASDQQPQVAPTSDLAVPVNQVASGSESAAQVNQLASSSEPAASANQITSTGEPATQVNYAALPGDVTANEACVSDGSTVSIVGIDAHHTATALA